MFSHVQGRLFDDEVGERAVLDVSDTIDRLPDSRSDRDEERIVSANHTDPADQARVFFIDLRCDALGYERHSPGSVVHQPITPQRILAALGKF